jgi:hypothetical protein
VKLKKPSFVAALLSDTDPDGPHGFFRTAAQGTSDTGNAQTNTSRGPFSDPSGHFQRSLTADGSITFQGGRLDAEEADFGIVGIGYRAAIVIS